MHSPGRLPTEMCIPKTVTLPKTGIIYISHRVQSSKCGKVVEIVDGSGCSNGLGYGRPLCWRREGGCDLFKRSSSVESELNIFAAAMAAMAAMRIVIVGDVHDDWDLLKDSKALHALKPDVVLFTGDFGNENVDLVRDVSKLDLPKAAILGNHDCWQTVSPFAPLFIDKSERNGVQEQLDLLGDAHVGFGRLDFSDLRLSVVGGRPFSSGGERIHSAYNSFGMLLAPRYGVHNFRESAERIVANAMEAPRDNLLIFLAHNGPRGLGSKVDDICGRDWVERGGDHGDPDFEEAIAAVKQARIKVPLVVFGHMHQQLQCGHPLERTMLVVGHDKTIYLNAAVVPRVRGIMDPGLTTLTQRHFVLVDFHNNEIEGIYEVWVTLGEDDCEVKLTSMYSRPGTAPVGVSDCRRSLM